jgi:hypothetical protein
MTPSLTVDDSSPVPAPLRHAEIEAWLKQFNRVGEKWVALDDRADWFMPSLVSLVCCDSQTGLTEDVAKQLKIKLTEAGFNPA